MPIVVGQRVADQPGQVVAGADLGQPGQRDDLQARLPTQPTSIVSGASASTSTRSSGVSRSTSSGPPSSTWTAPAAARPGRVLGTAARPERELDRIGRREDQDVGARPVPVRHEGDEGRFGARRTRRPVPAAGLGGRGEHGVERLAVEPRQVARQHDDGRRAPGERLGPGELERGVQAAVLVGERDGSGRPLPARGPPGRC